MERRDFLKLAGAVSVAAVVAPAALAEVAGAGVKKVGRGRVVEWLPPDLRPLGVEFHTLAPGAYFWWDNLIWIKSNDRLALSRDADAISDAVFHRFQPDALVLPLDGTRVDGELRGKIGDEAVNRLVAALRN